MTKDEIDVMWQKALRQALEENEQFTRYRFAALVAEKERAKIVTLLKGSLDEDDDADLWYLAIKCMIEKIEKVDAA